MSSVAATTYTLTVPGARLHYEVRGSGPVLALIGAPMDSAGFAAPAAELAAGHTVVTYDPRGISRSTRDDPEADLSPETTADDVARLLTALGSGPAPVFGSSGGAITGLVLAIRHPGVVSTLIAHEPPLVRLLPDADRLLAGLDDLYATFRREGAEAAMVKFFALTGPDGPAVVNLPATSDPLPPPVRATTNTEVFLAHLIRTFPTYRLDLAALREGPTRIVVAGGATSTGELPQRGAVALAELLGTPLVEFPGGHDGYIDAPAAFARMIRRVLGSSL